MPEIDHEWVNQQLEAAKVKVGSGKAILKLLETWDSIPDLSKNMTQEVLEVFPKLAKGINLIQEDSEDDYIWIDLQPGQITVGDVVRFKANAYEDIKLGPKFNGRLGKVVGIRYGEVYFKSTDGKEPLIDGSPHSPYTMQKRYRKN